MFQHLHILAQKPGIEFVALVSIDGHVVASTDHDHRKESLMAKYAAMHAMSYALMRETNYGALEVTRISTDNGFHFIMPVTCINAIMVLFTRNIEIFAFMDYIGEMRQIVAKICDT